MKTDGRLTSRDLTKLGGIAMGKLPKAAAAATIFAELGAGALKSDQVADLALGARLRGYSFDRYKTKRKDDEEQGPKKIELNFACSNPASAEKAWTRRAALGDGVALARVGVAADVHPQRVVTDVVDAGQVVALPGGAEALVDGWRGGLAGPGWRGVLAGHCSSCGQADAPPGGGVGRAGSQGPDRVGFPAWGSAAGGAAVPGSCRWGAGPYGRPISGCMCGGYP